MRAATAKDTNSDLLVRALAISLLLHLLCFGGWKFGQTHGWWKDSHLPNWLQMARDHLVDKIAKTIPQPKQQQQPVTLTFVDVDPTLAVKEPPKNAKFTSSANTVAASPKEADSELPDLNGKQEKVLKTTENQTKSKAQPLRPTPKELIEAEKPAPAPKAVAPGDLAIRKPNPKPNDSNSEQPQAAPHHRRPKTVEEAKAMQGIRGDKMHHDGGSPTRGLTSSLDVRRTVTGDYDRRFVDAVQERWDFLLQDHHPTPVGEVRVEFKLHYDGRITHMKVVHNTVDAFFAELCQAAILDNAPYDKWPIEMRRELAGDTRDVTFTFYYE